MVLSDHGFQPVTLPRSQITGHHQDGRDAVGVWFARGPGIAAGAGTQGSSIYRVLPTALAWMGLPLSDELVAAPAEFLAYPPPGRVASYEGAPIVRLESDGPGEEDEILEELRALGYLEADEPAARER